MKWSAGLPSNIKREKNNYQWSGKQLFMNTIVSIINHSRLGNNWMLMQLRIASDTDDVLRTSGVLLLGKLVLPVMLLCKQQLLPLWFYHFLKLFLLHRCKCSYRWPIITLGCRQWQKKFPKRTDPIRKDLHRCPSERVMPGKAVLVSWVLVSWESPSAGANEGTQIGLHYISRCFVPHASLTSPNPSSLCCCSYQPGRLACLHSITLRMNKAFEHTTLNFNPLRK